MSQGYKSVFNLNVLVVDDSRTFLKAFERFFHEEPYHIDFAENALIALEKISKTTEEQHYDLILLDITMPGMDGFEAIKEIRRRNVKVKVLAHTGTFAEHGREKFLEAGFDEVIPKPTPFPELQKSILLFCEKILEEHNAGVVKEETPRASPPSLSEKTQEERGKSLRKKPAFLSDLRILAVDDSKVIRHAIEWGLSKAPYKVDCVENGVLALERLDEPRDWQYDLILMDINMPFMSGSETVGAIRSLYPDLRIVAHTSEYPEKPKEHFLSLGFDDVIAKPLPLQEFRKVVDRLCHEILESQGIETSSFSQVLPSPPPAEKKEESVPREKASEPEPVPLEETDHLDAYNKLFQRVLRLEMEKKELLEKVKNLEKRLAGQDTLGS